MTDSRSCDVTIIGAGPAGLAAALAVHEAGLSAVVCETSVEASVAAAAGRSAALLKRTAEFLARLGVWRACETSAAPLTALQFIDDTGRIFRAPDCRFDASEIGEDAFGYNILNADLARILKDATADRRIPIVGTGRLVSLNHNEASVVARFENGAALESKLVIAADGRNSAAREAAGIRTMSWAYDQAAVATSFEHERDHKYMCIEIHRSGGPFTLVPLPGRRSSLVWVERTREAERLAGLGDTAFLREAEAVSQRALGKLTNPTPRANFPLGSLVAREMGKNRVALVGEAAHVNPPIGAQGLNLGFRDVENLAAHVRDAQASGEDVGGAALLGAYSSARRADVLGRTLGVDVLNRSLLSSFAPLQLGRGAGLYALGAIGPLRRTFMRRGIAPANLG